MASAESAHHESWVISPSSAPAFWRRAEELWRYRRVLLFFIRGAFRMLYAKTQLGWPWLLLRPLIPLVVGSFVFGEIMEVASGDLPYFLFFTIGMTAWNFFDGPLMWSTRSIDRNRRLITRLYFPRVLLPVANLSPGLLDPLIGIAVLIVANVYYFQTEGVWYLRLHLGLLVAVPIVALTLMSALSISLWTSLWQARARDVRFVVAYMLSFWFYFTPVIYPMATLPEPWRTVGRLNPLVGLVESFKWAVVPSGPFPLRSLAYATAVTGAMLALGLWNFHRVERSAADGL